ncbi:MAG: gliding motility-associated C-terminal domain-containing protein [Saprospiraceae bacterium]|nr:gliding motility-associated C-terminal domain-containing protein [Saprospiraceae bacterium]
MRLIFCFIAGLAIFQLSAQTSVGLQAYYSFDGSLENNTGNTSNTAIGNGAIEYRCGVRGDAILFDGVSTFLTVPGDNNVNDEFDTEDFTVSFYFKPIGVNGTPNLVSKRDTNCANLENIFQIRYSPASRSVNAVMIENLSRGVSLLEPLTNAACWQLVTLVRDASRVKLYINGRFARDLGTQGRIDLTNVGKLMIGGGDCRMLSEPLFHGLMDEFRIYNRALDEEEIAGLYFEPDQIANQDTVIFLGTSVDIRLTSSCGTGFNWTPDIDIFSSVEAEPTITPTAAGTYIYNLQLSDGVSSCIAGDSIRITVIDPDELDCEVLFLPKAFTPNGTGPVSNNTFGISNPFALQQLISFEIFDRWGGRVYYSEDGFQQWDGTHKGQDVNPGVFLYKIRFVCNGQEDVKTGSVTVFR